MRTVVASTAWDSLFGRQLAELDEAYAGGARAPAWVLPVELISSVVAGSRR